MQVDEAAAVDELERAISSCKKGECVALLIPYQAQADYQAAIRHFDRQIAELRKRGMRIKVSTVRKPDGLAMCVEQKRRKL